jgi:hypothetical protein
LYLIYATSRQDALMLARIELRAKVTPQYVAVKRHLSTRLFPGRAPVDFGKQIARVLNDLF